MDKILTALKSRTVWSIVILFLVSGFNGIQAILPAGSLELIQGILTLLAIYFRVNPRV